MSRLPLCPLGIENFSHRMEMTLVLYPIMYFVAFGLMAALSASVIGLTLRLLRNVVRFVLRLTARNSAPVGRRLTPYPVGVPR